MEAEVMRCVECKQFLRLDLRTTPATIICGKFPHGIDIDPHRGCGLGKPKDKGSEAWKVAPGMNWRKA